MVLWGIAIFCLCAAFLLLGYIIGVAILPRLAISEGTAYTSWLLNRTFGDHVEGLRRDEISYVQFDLDEYTVTFQKIHIWRPDNTTPNDLSDFTALEESESEDANLQ
jgi:hypothetical protein